MEITEVKVRLWNDQRLRALVTVVFEGCFVVRNIKVIEGRDNKMFVAMPSRKMPDGRYGDIAHPITRDYRHYMETTILSAYYEECEQAGRAPEAVAMDQPRERGGSYPSDEGPDIDDQPEKESSSREGWFGRR